MAFHPFLATVKNSKRISPNFQRVTFTGIDDMGPAGAIMDLRIKLVIPGPHGLPELKGEGDWYAEWKELDAEHRGWMRTYSVRELRRADAHVEGERLDGENSEAEIDIDFALHGVGTPHSGPAATFAVEAQPGDQLFIIAPEKDDESGPGIEFQPGDATNVVVLGDETALPAMLRIADEWPSHLTGTMYCELVDTADTPQIDFPENLTVHWVPRADHHTYGDMLVESAARLFELDNPRGEFTPPEPSGAQEAEPASMVWETPVYSSFEDENKAGEPTSTTAERFADTYFWIAGESSMVTTIRRMLVKGAGISRHQVSFMGYWKNGVSALG